MNKLMPMTLLATAVLAGCSSLKDNALYGESGLIRDRSQDYEASRKEQALVIPPHLQAKQLNNPLEIPDLDLTASERSTEFQVPRPEFFYADTTNEAVNLAREGDRKLIVVDEPIGDVWVKMQEFWRYNGVEIAKSDPVLGVMETQWLEREGEDIDAIGRWVKRLTFQRIDGPTKNKMQVRLKPTVDDPGRTSIQMRHVQFPAEQEVAAIDWNQQSRDIGYKSDMMFQMLRYLSKATGERSSASLVALRDQVSGGHQLGRDSRGNPVLKIDASLDTAWGMVDHALDAAALDVGTRDQRKGVFYLTYTTSTPYDETQKMGFFEWLHGDRGEIKLDTSFLERAIGVGEEGGEAGEDAIRYSAKAAPAKVASADGNDSPTHIVKEGEIEIPAADDELAQKDGFKIWLGGKVIYVFSTDEESGVYNEETGEVEHVGRYQLTLDRSSGGVLLQVFTDEGLTAPAIVAEEILWKLKDQLNQAG
ncbi:outer membrane protein assembly factor BamC [Marinobacterium arenosum]|uniref:outer membrane protein assembly factor BamC n=1 Tax=Marinobacterium arenosum TaxID=2862496 RepID=UPI001C986BF8|nr:outer membrane protein assembly factor BamC [Marinobacterium arenosum]MBY4675285.1 outer membrane protein assembly factor BamC [Marinobacterium arenosum]